MDFPIPPSFWWSTDTTRNLKGLQADIFVMMLKKSVSFAVETSCVASGQSWRGLERIFNQPFTLDVKFSLICIQIKSIFEIYFFFSSRWDSAWKDVNSHFENNWWLKLAGNAGCVCPAKGFRSSSTLKGWEHRLGFLCIFREKPARSWPVMVFLNVLNVFANFCHSTAWSCSNFPHLKF